MQQTLPNAHFVEQPVDFIRDFRAQFVIDLSSRSIDAGLRGLRTGFSTKLSTTSVSLVLLAPTACLHNRAHLQQYLHSRGEPFPCFRSYKPQAGRSGPWLPAPSLRSPSSSSAS